MLFLSQRGDATPSLVPNMECIVLRMTAQAAGSKWDVIMPIFCPPVALLFCTIVFASNVFNKLKNDIALECRF